MNSSLHESLPLLNASSTATTISTSFVMQLATLFSWYAALLILWIRRPWYDMSWGDNDSLVEEVRTARGCAESLLLQNQFRG